MTHGDKAKAKTGKSSQASASKKGSTQKAGGAAASSKGARKETARESKAGKTGKAEAPRISLKKASPAKAGAPEKRVAAPAPKATGSDKPARPVGGNGSGPFSNPVIATAFKHAVKKYSNAFRKLTD